MINLIKIHKNTFLNIAIFCVILLFLAPTHIKGNEYAFITRSLHFFNENNLFIGFSESILRAPILSIFFFFYNFFTFELGWKILRILTTFFFTLSLSHFATTFKISKVSILLGFFLFIFLNQAYFNTEFIFGTFELKTISYISIIFAFSFLERGKTLYATVFVCLAITSHFLVGYFWLLALCTYEYLKNKNLKKSFQFFLRVSLITMPIIIILFYENYFLNSITEAKEYNKIFLERHINLVNPYDISGAIKKSWYFGYFLIMLNICFLFIFNNLNLKIFNKKFFSLLILLNAYLLALTILLYFDKNFLLAKFIPFRPESLTLLLTLFSLSEVIFLLFKRLDFKKKTITLFLILILAALPITIDSKYNIVRVFQVLVQNIHYGINYSFKTIHSQLETDDIALLDWVKENIPETQAILFEDEINYSKTKLKDIKLFVQDDELLISKLLSSSWETLSSRPAYVNRDVIGGNIPELIRWNKRNNEKISIYKGNCEVIDNSQLTYFISFTVSAKNNLEKCLKKSYKKFGKYYLFINRK